jgi:uncharacterized membrane protein
MSRTNTLPLRPWLAVLPCLIIPGTGKTCCGEKEQQRSAEASAFSPNLVNQAKRNGCR